MNPMEEKVLQANPSRTTARFRKTEISPIKATTKAAIFKGNKQYPNKQTLWKKETVPPNNWALIVTTADPIHTTTKTIPNIRLAVSWELVVVLPEIDKVKASIKHNNKGPHKSQSRSSLDFSSSLIRGIMTHFSL